VRAHAEGRWPVREGSAILHYAAAEVRSLQSQLLAARLAARWGAVPAQLANCRCQTSPREDASAEAASAGGASLALWGGGVPRHAAFSAFWRSPPSGLLLGAPPAQPMV
jgi:hypothetical protein